MPEMAAHPLRLRAPRQKTPHAFGLLQEARIFLLFFYYCNYFGVMYEFIVEILNGSVVVSFCFVARDCRANETKYGSLRD